MHTQFLLAAWNPEITGVHLWVAVAILACVVLAELCGIGILIAKLVRVHRKSRTEETDAEEDGAGRYEYALAPLALTAIPQITYSILTVLLIAAAALAFVLAVMLIVVYAVGYDFARAEKKKKEEEATAVAEPAQTIRYEEAPAEEETPAYEGDENAAQESIVAAEAIPVVADEPVAEEPVDEPAEEQSETVAETKDEPVTGEVISSVPVPADTITTVVRTSEAIPPASGQGPYKVVEKVVTETYKEVVKEAPAAEAQKGSGTAADEVLAKLSNFLEYELEKRKAADAAAAESAESVPAFAKVEERLTSEDLDDEEDDDDDDLDETVEGDPVNEDDVDDEENDISDDRFTGNERIIGFDENTGCYIVAHYRKSFEAKLIQSRPNIKKYYSDLKNALLAYKGTKSRVSWTADSFHNGRSPLAKINVKTRILEIYLALDPATLEGTVYRGKDVGSKKKYADTPFQYKIRTPRKFKWAMELVQRVCEEHGLTPIDVEPVAYDEQYPFDTTENLVERKLIKEYIRQEKPASTFELADDHVPNVPDEDPSVIPANANFSWELDNDSMNDPARDPDPVPIPDAPAPEPEPEKVPEEKTEAPAPAPVYKETVKVTEVRYTEHYYANGDIATTVVETNGGTDAPVALVGENDGAEANGMAEEIPEESKERFFDEFDTDAGADKFGDADPFAAYRGEIEAEEPAEEVEYEEIEEVEEEEVPAETEEAEEAEEPEAALAWSDASESETVEEEAAETPTQETADNDEDVEVVYEYVYVDEDGNEIPYTGGELPEGYEEVVEEEETDEAAEEAEYEEVEEEPAPARPRIPHQSSNPTEALIDVRALEENFPDGATVNLEKLKAVGMARPETRTLQIYGSGPITKSFTIEADVFTIDAMRYIDDAKGNIVVVRKQGGFGK